MPKEKPVATVGSPIVPCGKVMDGIVYVLRTGCQWKMLPREYGSGSTCHRRFQEWVQLDIFKRIWIRLLKIYDNKKGIKWTWQSLDSISIKSPLGGGNDDRSNPTDRSKLGTKRHILTDTKGIPLSAVISSASTHDIKAVTEVVDNAVIKRPTSTIPATKNKTIKQRLCLDKACNSRMVKQEIIKQGYVLICHTREREAK